VNPPRPVALSEVTGPGNRVPRPCPERELQDIAGATWITGQALVLGEGIPEGGRIWLGQRGQGIQSGRIPEEGTLVEICVARNAVDLAGAMQPELPSLGVLGHPKENTKVSASIELAPGGSVWDPDMGKAAKDLGCRDIGSPRIQGLCRRSMLT
jgi:hypothetical protein